jgi:hypothetical protein
MLEPRYFYERALLITVSGFLFISIKKSEMPPCELSFMPAQEDPDHCFF